jgi:uncharacterized membrane protein
MKSSEIDEYNGRDTMQIIAFAAALLGSMFLALLVVAPKPQAVPIRKD